MNKKPFLDFFAFWVMVGWVIGVITIIVFSVFDFIVC